MIKIESFIAFCRGFFLVLLMLMFTACNTTKPNAEELSLEPVAGDLVTEQAYPPPEQPMTEQLPTGYPPLTETRVIPTPYSTSIPLALCDISQPVEVALTYEASASNWPTFSEPKIVATNDTGFSIGEWLPDSQQLLITQGDGASATISTLNVTTGEMVTYATRRDISNTPIWLNDANGVMYVDSTLDGWDLRFSDGKETSILATQLASTYIIKNPLSDNVATLFSLEPNAIRTVDATGGMELVTNVAFSEEAKRIPLSSTDGHRLAWSPDGKWLVQYRGEQVYLINTDTKDTCKIDLGDYGEAGKGKVGYIYWSPDSRYLSMSVSRQSTIPELNILDIERMEFSILSSLPLNTNRWPPESIGASAWSPNGQFIFLQVGDYDENTGKMLAKWLLLDIQTNQYTEILPDYRFLPGVGKIAWSPDGSKIAYSCHTVTEGKICVIELTQ